MTLIQSIFHAFGAGLLEPSTGIVGHNRGAAFTPHEGPALLVGGMRLQAGMPMREAMDMPRWVVGTFGQGDEIVVQAEGAPPAAALAALAAAGLPLVTGQARDDRAGHAQYAGLDAAGRRRAATDPRGDGDAPAA